MLKNHNGRIMGVETEYGLLLPDEKDSTELIFELKARVPGFVANGSRIYMDREVLECSTPERKSYREVLKYDKAGEILCRKYLPPRFNAIIVKNNIDKRMGRTGEKEVLNTFGCHENYSVKKINDNFNFYLTPFLVARNIMIGSGFLDENGQYFISQRADFIERHISGNTTFDRGLISTARNDEPLAKCGGKKRFHLICGDSNMCEDAMALKTGATELMISLIEDGFFPFVYYDSKQSVLDLKRINSEFCDWKLEGMIKGPKYAVDFLNLCEEKARKVYYGSNPDTDMLLDLWRKVNSGLASINTNPDFLVGKLDWVTKRFFLEEYARSEGLKLSDSKVQSNDIQYHRTDEESLFYQAQEDGLIHKIVSDEEIRDAVIESPDDSRANFRGQAIKLFDSYKNIINGNGLEMIVDWDYMGIVDVMRRNHVLWGKSLDDPSRSYNEYLLELNSFLSKYL